MINWVEKYRPKNFEEVVGQSEGVLKIRKYFEDFPNLKKKALLLGGGPGIGKTTLVHVLKNETNSEIFELNASDLRNKKSMQEKLKPVLEQTSLFKKNKLILVDEVDGISGNSDRGGLPELIRLIEESSYPVICTANDPWSSKLSALRKKVEIVGLSKLSPGDIRFTLKKILKREGKQINEETLDRISVKSQGDLRSAINDLESVAELGMEEVEIYERTKKQDIFNALKQIFQEKIDNNMLDVFNTVDMSLDEIMLWIEKNIIKVYSGYEMALAYQRLARADLFKGRIYKKQYWRFLVYENIFSSYGVSAAKGESEKRGFYKYERPSRILKIWLNNRKHGKRKTIAKKYGEKVHVGSKRIMKEWNEVKNILKNPIIQKELKLDYDEIAYIMKY
ncbi:MAG: replication factor C large subunit [Nanoarchaeota archaeon]|nr:replication factor C large subunit [Nanoarchaeota archaeon]